MNIDASQFNYQSLRARKARFARHIVSPAAFAGLLIASTLLFVSGLSLVFLLDLSLGWLATGLGAPFFMLAVWGEGELKNIPPEPNASTVDGLIASDLLGMLPEKPTPRQLMDIVGSLAGGQFFAARFGIVSSMFSSALSDQPEDSARIWQEAESLRVQLGAPTITAGLLAVALARNVPRIDEYLAHIRIDRDDLITGAAWYLHIRKIIEAHRARSGVNGGIGRDWSFGYTPLLSHFGFNVSEHINFNGLLVREIESREGVQAQVLKALSQGARRNAALVGPLGVGKTTLVYALARKMLKADSDVPSNLRYRQVIALDPAALISQAHGRGELEDLVHRLCYEAASAKNVVLFLDDAQLFFEEGMGSVDISNVLMPVLDGGAVQLILAMDEQRWLQISRQNPALAQYINRVVVTPTNRDETISVMQDQLITLEHRQDVTYTFQSLDAAYRLSERYIPDQAMPGRALKVLESAGGFAADGLVTYQSVEHAIEQTQGVKVGTVDSETERQTLLNLEDLIHQRMINQKRAVQVVSDALRRARAGVRNPNRPIGTFLFLGPTGVGKTELAKSVAAVFFGGEEHLVRIDLNEYVQSSDVARLIADGARDPHSLTAQIAKQPFSVVLLDEIEKAHPDVLSTLLQLLDEGILRDINNREVSFRDAVIIATSNAGAERIREHIQKGEQLEQFEQQFTDELISSGSFRPEFLNRFDEIVLFRPLNQDELLQVVDLTLAQLNKQLAVQKVSVVVDDDAKRLLVSAGYDPRLGARPMRRIVQRVVENIVANQMLAGQTTAGGQVHVTTEQVQQMLNR